MSTSSPQRARLGLALMVAVAGAVIASVVAANSASAQPEGSDTEVAAAPAFEQVTITMPFDGNWANNYRTAPWQHTGGFNSNWGMDIFGLDAPVIAGFANPTGDLELEVMKVGPGSRCSNGGSEVNIEARVDGVSVGHLVYYHLAETNVVEGQLIEAGQVVGRTAKSARSLSGGCWQVTTDGGVHTHFAAGNTVGTSCYVRYEKGQALPSFTPIGILGSGPFGDLAVNDRECHPGSMAIALNELAPCRPAAPNLETEPDALTLTIEPSDRISRAEFAAALHEFACLPDAPEISFTDVDADRTTSATLDAIAWAVDQGLIDSLPDNTFGPNRPITRMHAAEALYRLAGGRASTIGAGLVAENSDFPVLIDRPTTADEIAAIGWARRADLIPELSSRVFEPFGTVTSIDAASMLERLDTLRLSAINNPSKA